MIFVQNRTHDVHLRGFAENETFREKMQKIRKLSFVFRVKNKFRETILLFVANTPKVESSQEKIEKIFGNYNLKFMLKLIDL